MPARRCAAATTCCRCPTARARWTSTCDWYPNTSCVRPSALSLRRAAADQTRPLLFGLLFGGLVMLILHNLIRFLYTRSSTTLILALYHGLMLLSALILLNLSGPWWQLWHSAQTPPPI